MTVDKCSIFTEQFINESFQHYTFLLNLLINTQSRRQTLVVLMLHADRYLVRTSWILTMYYGFGPLTYVVSSDSGCDRQFMVEGEVL